MILCFPCPFYIHNVIKLFATRLGIFNFKYLHIRTCNFTSRRRCGINRFKLFKQSTAFSLFLTVSEVRAKNVMFRTFKRCTRTDHTAEVYVQHRCIIVYRDTNGWQTVSPRDFCVEKDAMRAP